ncbi:MAG: sigma-54-dependent Fis family transcriptional regulator [Opitutae bacterium]|nr:sigma-54-dependent Fis family transcriptional regulator [Opitutae bacterium]
MNVLLIGDEHNLPAPAPGSEPPAWRVQPARSAAELHRRLAEEKFQLALVELDFGPGSSEALLAKLHRAAPELPIVAIVERDEKTSRVRALRAAGVGGLLLRPFGFEEMRATFARHAKHEPKPGTAPAPPPRLLVSQDPAMQRVLETVERAADSPATILLAGESGTGKTVLARAIHARSRRAAKPFVTVSCPCLNRELLESELFGHAHGAFTGAVRDTWGKVSAADGGTLFLDEVGDLPASLQPKLLRLLQEREYERVGETKVHTADVRIIAASNRDLKASVENGRFREDLYYRLNVIAVELPPLRNRRADIAPLVHVFLTEIAQGTGRAAPALSPDAMQWLERQPWPGNLRELHNCLERAAVLHPAPVLDASAFADGAAPPLGATIRVGDQVSLRTVAEAHIREVIAQSPSLDQAAQILGINKSTLYRKRQRMHGGVTPFPPQERVG